MTDPLLLVRTALRANAAFSFAIGLLLAVAPNAVAGWLDVAIEPWLRGLGIALLGHVVLLAVFSQERNDERLRRWGTINLAVIAPYPLVMIGLVATGLVARGLGVTLVLIDGLVVGGLAILHAIGLRPAVTVPHPQGA